MRISRARRRAGLSMAATLPLLAGALALGIPSASADSAPGGRDALQGTKPPGRPPRPTRVPRPTAAR